MITNALLTSRANRPALRRKDRFMNEVLGIVIHWTANVHRGADAMANRNYFNRKYKVWNGRYYERNGSTRFRWGSAHYVVDDKQIVRCIPENEVAYHVGDRKPKLSLPYGPNQCLIGIEMCVNKDVDWMKVLENTKWLVQELRKRYPSIPIYRHYDVTGKDCPKMYLPIKVGGDKYDWSWQTLLKYFDL